MRLNGLRLYAKNDGGGEGASTKSVSKSAIVAICTARGGKLRNRNFRRLILEMWTIKIRLKTSFAHVTQDCIEVLDSCVGTAKFWSTDSQQTGLAGQS